MHVESVKRIIALNRQRKSYVALRKDGTLTAEECDLMLGKVDAELAAVRAQAELELKPPAPAKGAKSA